MRTIVQIASSPGSAAHVVAPRYICDDCLRDEHAVRAQMREHGQPSAVAVARGVAPMLCVDDPCGDDVAEEA